MRRSVDQQLQDYLNDEWGAALELIFDEEITTPGEMKWVPCDGCHKQPCEVCFGVGRRLVFVRQSEHKVSAA